MLLHILAYPAQATSIAIEWNYIPLLRLNDPTEEILSFTSLCKSLRQEQTTPPSKPQIATFSCILLHIATYPAQATSIALEWNYISLLRLNDTTEEILSFISLCNSLRQEQTTPPSKPQIAVFSCILLHIRAYPAQATSIALEWNYIPLLRFNDTTEGMLSFISLCNSLRQEQTTPPSRSQNAAYSCILLHIAAYPAQATAMSLRMKITFPCCD